MFVWLTAIAFWLVFKKDLFKFNKSREILYKRMQIKRKKNFDVIDKWTFPKNFENQKIVILTLTLLKKHPPDNILIFEVRKYIVSVNGSKKSFSKFHHVHLKILAFAIKSAPVLTFLLYFFQKLHLICLKGFWIRLWFFSSFVSTEAAFADVLQNRYS